MANKRFLFSFRSLESIKEQAHQAQHHGTGWKEKKNRHATAQLHGQSPYMVRNWTQQFQIRIALHFFWILTGSRSFSRKLDLIWNWLGNFRKKSVQFQFIWYVFFLRISSPKSEQVLLFDILKAFESSFFRIDTVFVRWHWQVTIYLTWYNQGLTIHYSFIKTNLELFEKKIGTGTDLELNGLWF